jgi:hypothetical protein
MGVYHGEVRYLIQEKGAELYESDRQAASR